MHDFRKYTTVIQSARSVPTVIGDSRFSKAHDQVTFDIIGWYHFVAYGTSNICQSQTVSIYSTVKGMLKYSKRMSHITADKNAI